jgi:hypothetical protein
MLEKRRKMKQTSESPLIQLKKNKSFVPKNIRLDQSAHQPIRTEWICSVSNISLCLNTNKNCFTDYHK